MTVFSLAISYLREDLLKEGKQHTADGDFKDDEIHWVLTVSAIWNDATKQFMREAAEKAGIPRNKLSIVLEPEATSLYCKHFSIHKTSTIAGMALGTFSEGAKYIVLDARGGTTDITVHEVLKNGGLKELNRASGGAWGGSNVDDKFILDAGSGTVDITVHEVLKNGGLKELNRASGGALGGYNVDDKFILVAGSGTVDITVHEVLENGGLKELNRASGGAWGGYNVDDKFILVAGSGTVDITVHEVLRNGGLKELNRASGGAWGGYNVDDKFILDAGSGTVDITVHEVLKNVGLKELNRASGGAWGGSNVDDKFNQFLIKIFGDPIMVKFRKDNMNDYIDIFRNFGMKKRNVTSNNEDTYQIRLPVSLVELFQEETGENIKETIQSIPFKGNVSLLNENKLQIDASVMRDFFTDALNNTIEHLAKLIEEPNVRGSKFILMAGGFSESPILQETIKANFPQMCVIVPSEAILVVLKGAAIYGHQENVM